MDLRGTRCETSHHLPKCGGISVPLSLMRTFSRPTTHHSTDRYCVRVAGPIGCDYPNNRLSAPYRWRVPSLASTRQSSRMSADTCESRFPTTKPAPMRRRAHELSWLRWIAAGGLLDDPLRAVRGEGRFSQPAQPGICRHRQNNVSVFHRHALFLLFPRQTPRTLRAASAWHACGHVLVSAGILASGDLSEGFVRAAPRLLGGDAPVTSNDEAPVGGLSSAAARPEVDDV